MSQNGDDSLSLFNLPQSPSLDPSNEVQKIGPDVSDSPPPLEDLAIGAAAQFAGDDSGDNFSSQLGDLEAEEQELRDPDSNGLSFLNNGQEKAHQEPEKEQLTIKELTNGSYEGNIESDEGRGNVIEKAFAEIDREDRNSTSQEILPFEERMPEGNGKEPGEGAGISGRDGADTSRPNEIFKQHSPSQTNMGETVLYNVAAGDEDGHSRQRILAFAAKRYASAVERNPEDYDALYNWALVLQESGDNIGSDASTHGKDQLLEEACKKYEEATKLCPTLHEAFYNWAIAISDRAKLRGRTKEAEDLWKQACKRYERAIQLNWNSPQALNNWGLALQELSGIVPIRDKQFIVRTSIKKFRIAIQLQFDFHRAIYNLGTVLYGLAEDTFRSGRQAKESTPTDLYSQSAIYIAAAHALKPEYPVYKSALRLVRSMLPLPYLKTGYLTVSPDGNSLAPHSDWKRTWFVLDNEALYQIETAEQKSVGQSPSRKLSGTASESSNIVGDKRPALRIEIAEIAILSPCADLSLPPGGGFCIDTAYGERYLIADTWEAVDGWVDAIRLAYTVYVRGQSDILAGILAS